MTRSAICGSDLHLLHGHDPDTRIGHTFGHEFPGIVEATRTRPAGTTGGQAEYVRVPFANVGPMKIHDDMHEEDVLFLSDVLPTGYQGAEMAEISPGATVVVFGCGPVGLFAMKSAWLMGAGRVIGVDHIDSRLRFAESYANVETLDFRAVDVIATIEEMTGGRGADACIDAVGCEAAGSAMQRALGMYLKAEGGSAHALNWCFHATRKGGRISVVGVYGPPWNIVDIGTAMNKQQTIRLGQCAVHRYMRHLLEHIRSGRIDAKGIITHRMSREDAPEAYDLFAKKRDGCVKCVLVPGGVA